MIKKYSFRWWMLSIPIIFLFCLFGVGILLLTYMIISLMIVELGVGLTIGLWLGALLMIVSGWVFLGDDK